MKTKPYWTSKNLLVFHLPPWNSILIFIVFCVSFDSMIYSHEKITSNFFYQKADSIASSIINHPIILEIISEDVDTNGKAIIWKYFFTDHEESNFTYINIYLGVDSLSYDIQTSSSPWSGCNPMDKGWINSDSAISIAEANGGKQFRNKYSDFQIIADLSKPSAGPYNVWDIRYGSRIFGKMFRIGIDALTNTVWYSFETSVNSNETEYIYKLFQNYPNPFNASTTITFSIDKPSFVALKLYDVTGRVEDVLLESFCEQGYHEIHWAPKTLSSGIYFCRMNFNRTILTKKLIYLK